MKETADFEGLKLSAVYKAKLIFKELIVISNEYQWILISDSHFQMFRWTMLYLGTTTLMMYGSDYGKSGPSFLSDGSRLSKTMAASIYIYELFSWIPFTKGIPCLKPV